MTAHEPRPASAISPIDADTGANGNCITITNSEREAIIGLIDPATGKSDVKNSTDGPKAFNHAATQAIFGMRGNNKWDHEIHFNRAKAVVLAMIASGEIEPIYNDIYAIVGIRLPSRLEIKHNDQIVDPRAVLLAKTLGNLAAASQKLGDEQEYHQDADEMLGSVLAENDRLRGSVNELNATISELRQSPRETELAEEIHALRRQLAGEQSARELAEGKLRNANEIAKFHSSQANDMRRANRALEQELRIAKKALGEVPNKEQASYEKGHDDGWTDGLTTVQDILCYASYDTELAVVSALIEDRTNRVPEVYNLLNDIKYAMEQLDKLKNPDCKSVNIYNRGKTPTANDQQKTEAKDLIEGSIAHFKARIRLLVEDIVISASLPSKAE